jgi:hypothetical protein
MSYTYIADRSANSVHVNLDTSDGVSGLGESDALDTIVRSQIHRGPPVIWQNYNIADPGNVFSGNAARGNGLPLFLKKAAELNKPATCVALFSAEEVSDEWEAVRQQITRTLVKLNESPVAGRVIVFVTKGAEAARFFDGRNLALGKFHRQEVVSTGKLEELSRAVAADAPTEENARWPWADDEEWVDRIDSLDKDEVLEIVDHNWHRLPLRRMKLALDELKRNFLSRNHAAEMLVASALARVNIVFLGPPGTASRKPWGFHRGNAPSVMSAR